MPPRGDGHDGGVGGLDYDAEIAHSLRVEQSTIAVGIGYALQLALRGVVLGGEHTVEVEKDDRFVQLLFFLVISDPTNVIISEL